MHAQNRTNFYTATILTVTLFIIYMVGLCWIIIFKMNVPIAHKGHIQSVNFIPFKRPLILNGKVGVSEMIANVLIFIPLGVYMGVLYKRWHFIKQCLFFFLISLACEVSQYVLRVGYADITDIINNTAGGIVGLLIFKGIEKICRDSIKAQKCINIVAATGTVLFIVLLLLLKINNLWIFRMHTLHR